MHNVTTLVIPYFNVGKLEAWCLVSTTIDKLYLIKVELRIHFAFMFQIIDWLADLTMFCGGNKSFPHNSMFHQQQNKWYP